MQLKIRTERIRRSWSTKYVGDQLGITDEAVRLIETGARRPSYDVLVKLENLFNLGHRDLFAETIEPDANQPTMKNDKLRAAREKSGKTQAQVAELAGIAEQDYRRYEHSCTEPGVRTAIRIADALDVIDLREIFPA